MALLHRTRTKKSASALLPQFKLACPAFRELAFVQHGSLGESMVSWGFAIEILRAPHDEEVPGQPYMGTSFMRNNPPLGPYSRIMSRALWRP